MAKKGAVAGITITMRRERPAGAATTMVKRAAAGITIMRKGKPADAAITTAKRAAAVGITIMEKRGAAVITTIMKRGIIMSTAIWPMWRPSLTARI